MKHTKIIIAILIGISNYANGLFAQEQGEFVTNESTINFVPNKGQIADRDGIVRPDVLFQLENQDVYLRKTGITYVLSNLENVIDEIHEKVEEMEESVEGLGDKSASEWKIEIMRQSTYKAHQISMDFVGVNPEFTVLNDSPSEDYMNFYLPHCPEGVTHVRSSKKVIYKNFYPLIDAVFYGAPSGDLKYDLILAPGADPSQIKIVWKGADQVFKDDEGNLIIANQIQNFKESIPEVYQIIHGQKTKITSTYTINKMEDGNYQVGFKLEKYNPEFSLVIDPWVTMYGGPLYDNSGDVAADGDENVYLCGATSSLTGIAMDGFQDEINSTDDNFLVKFNVDGARLWATYYGGELYETAKSLVCDSKNNIYMAGSTSSTDVFGFGGYKDTLTPAPFPYSYDAYLVKFDSAGIRLWSTYYGGEHDDYGNAVAVDPFDNVFLTGFTMSAIGIASDLSFDSDLDFSDAFLVKFDSLGNWLWATYFGGEGGENGLGCATDNWGNVFIGGPTGSTTAIAFDAYKDTISGLADCFIAKFDSLGNRLWSTYVGGEDMENGGYLACDSNGVVYLTGYTNSVSGLAFDGYQNDKDLMREAFLIKLSPDGAGLWCTYYGGNNEDYPFSCEVDPKSNNVLIAGDTYSYSLPKFDCAFQDDLGGGENAFVAQFKETGELYCATYFGIDHEDDNLMGISGCYFYVAGTAAVNVSTVGSFKDFVEGADAYLAQFYLSSCDIEQTEIDYEISTQNIEICGICNGTATIYINAIGCDELENIIDYKWSTGDSFLNTTDTISTIGDLCEGDYWVEIRHSCDQIDTVFFTIDLEGGNPIIADFESESACVGDPVLFTNLSTDLSGLALIYEWNFGDFGLSTEENPNHTFVSPGLYTVVLVVENENGCIDSIAKEIRVYDSYFTEYSATVCKDTVITYPDGSQTLINQSGEVIFTYQTENGCDSIIFLNLTVNPIYESTTVLTVPFNSSYTFPSGETIIVTNEIRDTSKFKQENGCDSILVTFIRIFDYSFEPPNVFSPGSDSFNNTFFFPKENVKELECVVTNRWGVVVFRFDSIEDEWDGTNMKNGENCSDGVYFIVYSGTFDNGVFFEGQSTVQLIRD
jgi:PKD repeat protein